MKIVVAQGSGNNRPYHEALEAEGHEVVSPSKGSGTDAEIAALAAGAQVLVRLAASRSLIEAMPSVWAVVGHAVGFDKIDVDAATDHGVLVCNSPAPENVNGVAETTIGFMVALAKRIHRKEARLRAGGWTDQSDRGVLLWRKTAGIIGLGRIGSAVARRLMGWDMRIIAHSPRTDPAYAATLGVELVSLDQLLRESDFVTLHLPSREENQGLLGAAELGLMKQGAFLVNTARGGMVDEGALARLVRDERLAGVALDVFEREPLQADSPLRDLDPERVILTPHSGSSSLESAQGNLQRALQNVRTVLRREMPEDTVNPRIEGQWRALTTTED